MIGTKDYVIKISVREATEDDLVLALEEVNRLVKEGYASGVDTNLSWEVKEDE